MRLIRLDLIAFGPFTNRTLDFTSEEPGLHLVFGRNEAGKSSSLRALKALLYGFPPQTPDNFTHNYDQLLVGGCLVKSSGEKLFFQRRKKRQGDLLDGAGNPLKPSVLTSFLDGVEPEIFASLYGLDHDALVRGGEEILAQKGAVGQALFAAGAGISSLREVILELDEEAGELFKATGQNPKINKAIKRFRELQRQAREKSLSAKEWKDQQKLLENGLAERAALEIERENLNREVLRLERLRQAIPELAALQSHRDRLAALGTVVPLDPGFAERYRQVSRELRETGQHLQRDRERLGKLADKRRAISLNRLLLGEAERIDDFHQRLGEYRKAQKDRPELNGMRIGLRTEAGRLLQQVRPDLDLGRTETLRPLLARKKTVRTLAGQEEAIRQKRDLAKKQGRAAEEEQVLVARGLAALPVAKEAAGLVQVVKLAQKAGDLDRLLAKGRGDLEQNKRQCRTELKRLGLWDGELAALMEVSLPLAATLRKFEKRATELADGRRDLENRRQRDDQELRNTLAELKRLESGGQVPSEVELLAIRTKREQGWQLVRRSWLDREDVREESQHYSPLQPLPAAYEAAVGQADNLADRLRREADRVAGAAALQVQAESLREALAANGRELEANEKLQEDLQVDWFGIWQPAAISPLSPKEMSDWLAEIDKLRFKVGDILKREQELERVSGQRDALKQGLEAELRVLGQSKIAGKEELSPVLALAETVLEQIAAGRSEREKLLERRDLAARAVRRASDDLDGAEAALAGWQDQWRQAIAGLGASDELPPAEAVERLDTLQSCFDKLQEAEILQKRIDGIDRDAEAFDREVRALLQQVASQMTVLPIDQAVLRLRTMLDQAQQAAALDAELSETIEALQGEVDAAGQTLRGAAAEMENLLVLAKCAGPDQLPAVIERFAEYKKLESRIGDSEANLARIGAGVGVAELTRQATEVRVDELPGRLAALAGEIEERINPEINRISQAIGEVSGKLAAMDGSGQAAVVADQMEQELAGIGRLAERYMVVKLAARVLQQEIERYREEHQDPILKIGSRYFGELTRGSFTGLRTDVDDKGSPVLVGVRPGDVRLTVDKMSSGTRDQLFLALRLATLEWRLAGSEPMPFIVDDILINFDDDRSRATLTVLADLARRNQVILFTHHRRIVDEALTIAGRERVRVHEL